MKHITIFLMLMAIVSSITFSQTENKANYEEPKNEFYKQMKKDLADFNKVDKKKKQYFRMDFEGVDVPKSIDEFEIFWHNAPVSQGFTGTC